MVYKRPASDFFKLLLVANVIFAVIGLAFGYLPLFLVLTNVIFCLLGFKWFLVQQTYSVELTEFEIVGPSHLVLNDRISIPISKIDRTKSGQSGFISKQLKYVEIVSTDGRSIRLNFGVLGKKLVIEILNRLGIQCAV